MKNFLVIGSRGSKLALVQAEKIKTELELLNSGREVRIEVIKTSGDVSAEPLSAIGGRGVFTKELEEALVDGRIDVAVHSLKDLPTIVPEQLVVAAICKREDPRDALVLGQKPSPSRNSIDVGINTLSKGAIVGTSSPRRLAQLKHLRRDLVFKELRGNVDTRLRKLDEGQYDALVLACAGLRRLALDNRITSALSTDQVLPAVGQGALAIETRAGDVDTIALVGRLDHKFTRLACTAERAFLRGLGGGCQLPIAAFAVVREKKIRLQGLVVDAQGKRILRDRLSAPLAEAEELGTRLAEQLLASGAAKLLAEE